MSRTLDRAARALDRMGCSAADKRLPCPTPDRACSGGHGDEPCPCGCDGARKRIGRDQYPQNYQVTVMGKNDKGESATVSVAVRQAASRYKAFTEAEESVRSSGVLREPIRAISAL